MNQLGVIAPKEKWTREVENIGKAGKRTSLSINNMAVANSQSVLEPTDTCQNPYHTLH